MTTATGRVDAGGGPERILEHAKMVAGQMKFGYVVPFLGAGVNLCERPPRTKWRRGKYLPNADELAHELASAVPHYAAVVLNDLVRASQAVDHELGWASLYETLNTVFDHEYEPTVVHHFLAEIPSLMRDLLTQPRDAHQLIVTTNYDYTLEVAFDRAGEEYDVVWYSARGDDTGKFFHLPYAATLAKPIDLPNEYELSLAERTVILKIHGAVRRGLDATSSYVITEDDYIDYLTRTDISNLIPATLVAKLKHSNILFLGYSMRDWNLRAIFHRIWQEQLRGYRAWAIRQPLSELRAGAPAKTTAARRKRELERSLERVFWDARNVTIFDSDLAEYMRALRQAFP